MIMMTDEDANLKMKILKKCFLELLTFFRWDVLEEVGDLRSRGKSNLHQTKALRLISNLSSRLLGMMWANHIRNPQTLKVGVKEVVIQQIKDRNVIHKATMDELLWECEDANPEAFVEDGNNSADGYNPNVDAPDRHSVGENYGVDSWSDTSDEDDHQPNEPFSVPTNADENDPPSESSRRATRGHAKPHILREHQIRPTGYIFLGECLLAEGGKKTFLV